MESTIHQPSRVRSDQNLAIDEIEDASDLQALASEWRDLWRACADATPFQSPEWLLPWAAHFPPAELHVLCLRVRGALVALVPFCVPDNSAVPQHAVILLGTGNSDYLDILALKPWRTASAKAIFNWLQLHDAVWDSCDLQQLRPGSVLLNLLAPRECDVRTFQQSVCPVLPLGRKIDGFPERVPHSMRQEIVYSRRKLKRLPSIRFETASAETFDHAFDEFQILHSARFRDRASSGAFPDGNARAFHREAALNLLASGVARLYSMRSNNQTVAALYGFVHCNRFMFYLSGFDTRFSSFSPGTLMIAHAIEQAMEEGCDVCDFLRGNESYKYNWGATDTPCYRRFIKRAPRD